MAELKRDLQENRALLTSLMGESSDFIFRGFMLSSGQEAALLYIDGLVDKQTVQDNLLTALLEYNSSEELTVQSVKNRILAFGEVAVTQTAEDALDRLLAGGVLLLLNGSGEGIVVSAPGVKERSISESKTQSIVKGPQDAFTEAIRTNTALVRKRIKDIRLRLVNMQIGEKTKTDVSVMYLEGVADPKILSRIIDRLRALKKDRILEGEYLEELITEEKRRTIFPVIFNSDRPDVISGGVLEGKVAIFIDGTPFVLLAPALFTDFIQSAEDYYQPALFSSLIRILRYVSLFISMFAPAIYIALTTFHQDMLPTQLLLSLAAQREGIPFPAFLEALLMEITFEILREAGIRMPRTIGQAVSIVGTIVVGQAAVEAAIVSPAMVIVVSITAIASFVIPAYSMSIPLRMLRFVFMGLAAVLGVYGLTIGAILLTVHLSSLHSFGVPYLRPIAPFNKEEQSDAVLRFPFHKKTN
ncbi:spore germination protein [Gorillibacterium sp. sgz500922]|uniref:spore germination protein n=1 Tax=Gorillibacterium sp. sgz500922 TaxID=3446694 RepID=UPI003F67B6D8